MKRLLMLSLLIVFYFLIVSFAFGAAKVYVIGSPTDFPKWNKTLPVKIKVADYAAYDGYVLLSMYSTSSLTGQCGNYPLNSLDTSADLKLLALDNTGPRWSDLRNRYFEVFTARQFFRNNA